MATAKQRARIEEAARPLTIEGGAHAETARRHSGDNGRRVGSAVQFVEALAAATRALPGVRADRLALVGHSRGAGAGCAKTCFSVAWQESFESLSKCGSFDLGAVLPPKSTSAAVCCPDRRTLAGRRREEKARTRATADTNGTSASPDQVSKRVDSNVARARQCTSCP
jgi:hypothetical protein